jgi:hypothetical protein
MSNSFLGKILLMLTSVLIVIGCASTGSPSGGPNDTQAPGLIKEKSSPNFSTNYTPEKIELEFDEWIELKNQAKEILISPPFFKKPKITQRGKKVTVEFPEDEPLRQDATYTLNFGNSIVDFTESNPVEGFRFLFATGDKIDSLTFGGTIVEAYGGEPVEDVLIMLYDVLGDSVVVSDKPFYYARASVDGDFKFENLKNDTFKLIVIEDLNLNYLLDDEVERLAFVDSSFILNDSTDFAPELRLFTPEQTTRIINSTSKVKGQITTIFNKKADEIGYEFLYPSDFNPIVETIEDTIRYWFSDPLDSVGIIFGVDTLDFTIPPFDSVFYTKKITLKDDNLTKSKLAPFDSLVLMFSSPLKTIDTSFMILSDLPKEIKVDSISAKLDSLGNSKGLSKIKLKKDRNKSRIDSLATVDSIQVSKGQERLGLDSLTMGKDTLGLDLSDTISIYSFDASLDSRSFILNHKWEQNHDYQLTILPGGLVDIYGRTCDTLVYKFKTSAMEEFGNIKLTISEIDSNSQYIVILRDGKKTIEEEIVIGGENSKITFSRLPLSTYNVYLINDENKDGKWTTGDYWKGRQPELLKKFELEKLRENWDLEANISWEGIVKDTMGLGVDSTFMKLDSLENKMPSDAEIKSQLPKQDKSKRSGSNKSKGRGRKG